MSSYLRKVPLSESTRALFRRHARRHLLAIIATGLPLASPVNMATARTSPPAAQAFAAGLADVQLNRTIQAGLSTLDRLPFLDTQVQVRQVSSHAPDGSNLDSGHYLYQDSAGRYVLMDAQGPGAITRIWMTRPSFSDSDSAIGRIEIFFDGEQRPTVNLPAGDFFAGRTPPFIAPLCGDERVSSGGDYCELRMPFRTGARVVVTGKPPYFNIGYELYPPGTAVNTFAPFHGSTLRIAARQSHMLSRAGRDPMIIPPGGRAYAGSATLDSGTRKILADARHPGTIRALKIRIGPHDDLALHDVWIEAYWDGSSKPAIAAPLADLFMSGAGERTPARGLLAGYLPDLHEGYLYFPMPFARTARIDLVNHSPQAIAARWQIQTSPVRYTGLGSDVGELHATYSHDRATATGKDFVALDTRGQGKVVGISFTEEGPGSGLLPLFMEGDERVYIDGTQSPQIYGTGTEDMFSGGYYYQRGPFSMPTHGATTKETTIRGDGLTSQYRLLLDDPWPFRDGIHLGIEHGAGDGLPTSVRSVVFWYGDERQRASVTSGIDVGNRASEAAAGYRASGPDPKYILTAFYEGDHDGNISSLRYDFRIPPAPRLSTGTAGKRSDARVDHRLRPPTPSRRRHQVQPSNRSPQPRRGASPSRRPGGFRPACSRFRRRTASWHLAHPRVQSRQALGGQRLLPSKHGHRRAHACVTHTARPRTDQPRRRRIPRMDRLPLHRAIDPEANRPRSSKMRRLQRPARG